MTGINNLIDFGDVFNAIRLEERTQIVQLLETVLTEDNAELIKTIIDGIQELPLPGGNSEPTAD